MNDLSLYILDLVQNSLNAKSTFITVKINEDHSKNLFEIEIKDNGMGINNKNLSRVIDPFYTTRTTRKVGMGLALVKEIIEQANGLLSISSAENIGTTLNMSMEFNHINRLPLGKIEDTIYTLFINDENADIEYIHIINSKQFIISTIEIKKILDGLSVRHCKIKEWLTDYILTSLQMINEEGQ